MSPLRMYIFIGSIWLCIVLYELVTNNALSRVAANYRSQLRDKGIPDSAGKILLYIDYFLFLLTLIFAWPIWLAVVLYFVFKDDDDDGGI